MLFGGQYLALAVTIFSRTCADPVGSFERQQWFITMDDIERGKRALEILRELFGRYAHVVTCPRKVRVLTRVPGVRIELRDLQAAHHLLHGVGLHVPVEQRLFLLFTEHVGIVIEQIALEQDFI